MRNLPIISALLCLLLFSSVSKAQDYQVSIVTDDQGSILILNDEAHMVNGMNWDYLPIGTNYNYSLWSKSAQCTHRCCYFMDFIHCRKKASRKGFWYALGHGLCSEHTSFFILREVHFKYCGLRLAFCKAIG